MKAKLILAGLIFVGISTGAAIFWKNNDYSPEHYLVVAKTLTNWDEYVKLTIKFIKKAAIKDTTSLIRSLSDADQNYVLNCSLSKTVAELQANCETYAEYTKCMDNDYLRTAMAMDNKCALIASTMPVMNQNNLLSCLREFGKK